MKRILCFILLLTILAVGSGCNKNSDNYKMPANFYYRNASVAFFEDDSIIAFEVRETVTQKDNLIDLLNTYLSGPFSDKLVSPFPSGLKVISAEQQNNTLIITLNKVFSTISGLDLTVACSCIYTTVTELTGCTTVEIQTEGQLPDNVTSIVLSNENLLFTDSVD